MSDIPLDNEKIKYYLSKDLKLEKKNFSYEIIEIASDNDFKKVHDQHKPNTPPFFQIIHECKPECTISSGTIQEITIQPNHYSLLVYYENEVYYFDPSYDSKNLYVCNRIKERFENTNVHIMKTRLQTDRYTCGTYVCEFIRQISNKYHEVQNYTIDKTDFKTYLQDENDSNGDFMLLAQSGETLKNKYGKKIEEYEELLKKAKEEQGQFEKLKVEILSGLNKESVEYKCIKRCNENKDIKFDECIDIGIIGKIINKTIKELQNNCTNKHKKYAIDQIQGMQQTIKNLEIIQENITKYIDLNIQILNNELQKEQYKILLQQLANICGTLQQNHQSKSKENILQSLKKIQIEPQQQADPTLQPQTIQTIHNQLLKGFTIKK